MNSAIERSIKFIWERYDEPLSLTDIACSAILSRFHFCRIFKEATGVSPGRFLSAVRIYQAKRMLLNTDLKVTDISFAVGYNSLGSFTNHFTASVGVSPGRFRRGPGQEAFDRRVQPLRRAGLDGTVTGTITRPEGFGWTRVYLGVFDDPIVQHYPIAATVVDVSDTGEPQPYRLADVPNGAWYIHAVAAADTLDREPWSHRTVLVDTQQLDLLRPGASISADISLRHRRPTDLPILLALPDLETEPDDSDNELTESVTPQVLSRIAS